MVRRRRQTARRFAVAAAAGVGAALTAGGAARAALVITASNAGVETVDNGTYDVIDFYLTGLTAPDNANQSGGAGTAGLLDLQGTFTASGAGLLGVPGDSNSSSPGYFAKYTTNASVPPSGYDSSYVNFNGYNSVVRSGTGTSTVTGTGRSATVTAITGNSASFGGDWFNSDGSSITPSSTSLIAQVLVTPGYGVSFTGVYGTYGSPSNGSSVTFSYTAPGPFISLTTAAPTGLSNLNAPLPVNGSNGSYRVGTSTFANVSSGFVAVTGTGFKPGTDTEVYGLRVLENGAVPSAADLSTIIADINAANGYTDTLGGTLSASNVSGSAYAREFPNDDLLLTTSGTTGSTALSPYVGFNFTTLTGITGTVTVNSISAVPEPASLAALVAGAAGVLGARRRRRVRASVECGSASSN
jgi:hypothetical protein